MIEMPVLFENGGSGAIAFTKNVVNALVDGNTLIVADPFGPVVYFEGQLAGDIFEDYVRRTAEKVGFLPTRVLPTDDSIYAASEGSIHCATNVLRVIAVADSQKWWNR